MKTAFDNISFELDEKSLAVSLNADGRVWKWDNEFKPRILTKDGQEILFTSAKNITHKPERTGVGAGVRSAFSGFSVNGSEVDFAFETYIWIESVSHDVFFELIPVNDDGIDVKAVYWPCEMEFNHDSADWYTVINLLQGVLIPNNWKETIGRLHFDGQMCSCAAYMPWFGQVNTEGGYIAICEQPWDAAYQVKHEAGDTSVNVGVRWLTSLGKMRYRRVMRYTFLNDCDYNDLCKVYRAYVKETGLFTSLAEKAAKNPLVDKLIGSGVVHCGIKTHVSPDSAFYDKENPEKNDNLVPFEARINEVKRYHEKGVEKLYLHLDGWGQPGYDNKHPDYTPACAEAGGWEKMKELSDTMKKFNYMFGIHDQYRDYYFDAATFDTEYACRDTEGKIFEWARWAGGRQTYLCATQAPYYVKRNFEELFKHGIQLEATYLDVFTCNEGDECDNPRHRMTRRECFEFRAACFDYLTSKGILPSSEEVTDWAMKSLVFAHYGPYDFMLDAPGAPRRGIPVPLYNLVYHDCMILPWPMEKHEGEDYMLYALLNGGSAYIDRDGAYPNTDGAFDSEADKRLDEQIRRYRIVAQLQEKIAKCEMTRHELLSPDGRKQRSTFSDGTVVTIDFDADTYEIK